MTSSLRQSVPVSLACSTLCCCRKTFSADLAAKVIKSCIQQLLILQVLNQNIQRRCEDRYILNGSRDFAVVAQVALTGWAKKVTPLVHYITLYERYHFLAHHVYVNANQLTSHTHRKKQVFKDFEQLKNLWGFGGIFGAALRFPLLQLFINRVIVYIFPVRSQCILSIIWHKFMAFPKYLLFFQTNQSVVELAKFRVSNIENEYNLTSKLEVYVDARKKTKITHVTIFLF